MALNSVQTYLVEEICGGVCLEVKAAMAVHPPLNSAHEAYAVILEELDEFWEEVRKKRENRDPDKMRTELTQTAAMCVRAIYDLLEVA